MRRRDDVAGLVSLATQRYGRLDVLISNVGMGPVSALDDLRVEDRGEMVDANIKGLLYGVAAALPVFKAQQAGQFVDVASTAAYRTVPGQTVYSAKVATRTISEGLRQEAGDKIRVTVVRPASRGRISSMARLTPQVRAELAATRDRLALSPEAVARTIAFAIAQPADVDVNEIVVRSTARG